MINLLVLAATIEVKGGITLDIMTGVQPVAGFAVAVEHSPEFRFVSLGTEDTAVTVLRFIADNWARLSLPRIHLGAWTDSTGEIVLDLSEVLADRASALEIAAKRGELAIWDIAGGCEIRL